MESDDVTHLYGQRQVLYDVPHGVDRVLVEATLLVDGVELAAVAQRYQDLLLIRIHTLEVLWK